MRATGVAAIVALVALVVACAPTIDHSTPPVSSRGVLRTTTSAVPDHREPTGSTSAPATSPGSSASSSVLAPAPSSARACHLESPLGWTSEGHNTEPGVFVTPEGTVRGVMVFVDFPDAPAEANVDPRDRDASSYYDDLIPEAAAWLSTSSFGRLTLEVTFSPAWLRMPEPSTDYGIRRGLSFGDQEAYVEQVVALAESTVDFSSYDLIYIVPSRNAAGIEFSPAYVNQYDTVRTSKGVTVSHGVTFGQDIPIWGYKVTVHETLHTFGLADLYSGGGTAGVADPSTHVFVGGWGIMGNILGPAPELFAWDKWKLRWIDDRQVRCAVAAGDTAVTLDPIETGGEALAVVIPTSSTTAIIAENRQAEGNDAGACSSGVLVYRLDTAIATLLGPLRVVDARPGDGSGCAELDDAPMDLDPPGPPSSSVFIDEQAGVTITLGAEHDGRWDLVVHRDHASG